MGADCSSGNGEYNIKYFIQKYGQQTMLNVAKANIKRQQILNKLPSITQKYRKNIHNAKISSIRQLNTVQTSLFNQIQLRIKAIQKSDTGEVTKAENHFDKCAEDIMGRQQIRKDCSQLRKTITKNYDQEEIKTKQKIQKDFQNHVIQIQKKRKQQFSEYQSLTNQNRMCIRKEMWKKYTQELKQYKKQVVKDVESGNIIEMVDLRSNYDHLHPTRQIQQIQKKGEKLIDQGEQIIMGKQIFGTNTKDILPPVGCCGF